MSAENPLDLPEGHLFGRNNLPYGVFSTADTPGRRRIGVRYGDHVLDLGAAAEAFGSPHAALLTAPTLNPLLAAGRAVWTAVRTDARLWLTSPAGGPPKGSSPSEDAPAADAAAGSSGDGSSGSSGSNRPDVASLLVPLSEVTLHLPFEVADYVDFYASEHHATNVGRIFRPNDAPLTPNWKHLPIGYHGRAGTVVVSGTEIVRPHGQRRAAPKEQAGGAGSAAPAGPEFGPSQRLDIEAEVGFVVGTPSRMGEPVPQSGFREHVFGVCLLNDWSARDIQAWEYVPLGPFLGKSFATSVSAWITPLEALDSARTAPPARSHPLLEYLDDSGTEPAGLDLRITVSLNGTVIAEPPFSAMYWTAAQQLAHLTVGGASLRTGDLFASGTVSGPEPHQRGCLLELTWAGQEPLELPEGSRTFLRDGDEVTLTAWAPGPEESRVGLGEVSGRIAC